MGAIALINFSKAYDNLDTKYKVDCIDKTGSNLHIMADMKKLYIWLVTHDSIIRQLFFNFAISYLFLFIIMRPWQRMRPWQHLPW